MFVALVRLALPANSTGFLFQRYNDAMATIRRIPSIEHNFQLVITRVYEDGDQELLEDEEESTFIRCLSISPPPYSSISRRRTRVPH